MKFSRTIAAVAVAALFSAQSALAFTPIQPIQFNPVISPLPLLPGLSCSVDASIKATDTTHNQVTYKVTYTSGAALANANYTITATNDYTTRSEIIVKRVGVVNIKAGSGSFAPDGKPELFYTFKTTGVASVKLTAKINNTECTAKTLTPVAFNAVAAAAGSGNVALQPGALTPISAIDFTKLPRCTVYAEVAARADGSYLIGTAINYENYTKEGYDYTLTGFANGSTIATTTVNGRTVADGKGLIMNPNGGGFLFNFLPKAAGYTYVVKAKLGNVTCKSITFTAPEKPGSAVVAAPEGGNNAAAGSNGNADASVEGSGAMGSAGQAAADADAQAAAEVAAAVTTSGNTTIVGDVAPGTLTTNAGAEATVSDDDDGDDDTNSIADYILYALVASAALTLTGYGAYRLSQRGKTQA